ncbi:hypothetical protein HRbin32_00680 [bacterium HR32]|nr:hypothetical protein HRbin32_00680 [bacterium HR32]
MWWGLLRAASLANLLWLPVWERVLYSRAWGVRATEAHAAAVVGLVSLALALWAVEAVCRRWGGAGRVLWTVLVGSGLLVPLNVVRRTVLPVHLGGGPWPWELKVLGLVGAVALVVWVAVRHLPAAERLLGGLLVACVPFVAVTLAQSLVLVWPGPGRPAEVQLTGPRTVVRRTVVLLFDELDYELAFERREPGLRLDEFDRLAARSLRGTRVRSTADRTLKAVPTMLTGRWVDEAVLDSRNRLWVRFHGEEEFQELARAQTLFRTASAAGARLAVVGAWLPYCGLVPQGSPCWQVPLLNDGGAGWEGPRPRDHTAVLEALGRQAVHAARAAPVLSRWLQEDPDAWYRRLLEASVQAVSDPTRDLAWVHLPIPHPPWVFDRAEQRVRYSAGGYGDNLALADRTLRALREAMERAGVWQDSVVVVTSDHWYRERKGDDRRVPLFVRFPDEVGWEYSEPADITLVHDLVRAVLEGEARSASELARWLSPLGP